MLLLLCTVHPQLDPIATQTRRATNLGEDFRASCLLLELTQEQNTEARAPLTRLGFFVAVMSPQAASPLTPMQMQITHLGERESNPGRSSEELLPPSR